MQSILIRNARIVNEGRIYEGDIYIKNGLIETIGAASGKKADLEIEAAGLYAFPGVIDDQVHFREPGLTHKAEIYTEARAAVAGGTTSFMEMPNTRPPALSQERLEEKYQRAAAVSLANYSFFMGCSNDNLEEVLKTDPERVCGVKVFMGSSTGNMLVDDENTLRQLFRQSPLLIATHCEDEATIKGNEARYKAEFGEDIDMAMHPLIRSAEACYLSSSLAVALAREFDSRLHILHISTARELELFDNSIPRSEKRITSEVCVHHLSFDDSDYSELGTLIKCNPAIKSRDDREALLAALKDGRLDIIATDHAPHTREEKDNPYFSAPSGLPLVQHSLVMMLEFYHRGLLTLEEIADRMAHAPADIFKIKERGYLREGYRADIALVDLSDPWTVSKENILYKCGWSPLEGRRFRSRVKHTLVSGHPVFRHDENGFHFDESRKGERLLFDRS